MVKKTFCDECGNEIVNGCPYSVVLRYDDPGRTERGSFFIYVELCKSCVAPVKKMFKEWKKI